MRISFGLMDVITSRDIILQNLCHRQNLKSFWIYNSRSNKENKMIKTTLEVEGMMCGMCESHVNEAIRKALDVKKVSSSHSKGSTEIISENPLDEEKVKEAVNATGYQVLSVKSESYEKKGFSLFHKK